MQKIAPFLWFNDQAEEAAQYYVSIFKNSTIHSVSRYEGKEVEAVSGKKEGSVMAVSFTLDGQEFTALNGGPIFTFSPAISFVISCDTQEEVDYYWEKLSAGGDPKAQQCGWLADKFGLSWQVVPKVLNDLLGDSDPKVREHVTNAMLKMKKIDIADLKKAAEAS